jgi:hypothetical protein
VLVLPQKSHFPRKKVEMKPIDSALGGRAVIVHGN